MLLHALILATLTVEPCRTSCCFVLGKRKSYVIYMEMTIASPFWVVGSWRGRTVRFRCYSFLSFFSNESHRVSGNPAAKRCQVTFVVATKKMLAASNPFSGNKSPWCWPFFGKKQGSGFLSHKKVKVTLAHSLTLFWILGWGGYLLVRLHKLNHESCEVAAPYGSLWPKLNLPSTLSTMFNSPQVLVMIIEFVSGHKLNILNFEFMNL